MGLALLEAVGFEAQGAAVFGDGADYVFWRAVGNLCLDLEGNFYTCAYECGEVLGDFFGNLAGVTTYARGV